MFLQLSNTRKISTLVALYGINSRAWHNLTFLLCRRSCAMQCQWARSCHSKWLHNDFLYRVEGAACIRHTYFSLGWCWWVWHLGKFELCNFGLVLFCSLQGRRLWPAMGEFCKLGQNLGCKSCSMLLLLLLALHHSGLEGSQLWGSQLACRLALFQSYYCLTDELLGHSILGIEHHWLLGQSVSVVLAAWFFIYLKETVSHQQKQITWYGILVKIGEFERMNSYLLGHCWVHAVDNLFRDYLGFSWMSSTLYQMYLCCTMVWRASALCPCSAN